MEDVLTLDGLNKYDELNKKYINDNNQALLDKIKEIQEHCDDFDVISEDDIDALFE